MAETAPIELVSSARLSRPAREEEGRGRQRFLDGLGGLLLNRLFSVDRRTGRRGSTGRRRCPAGFSALTREPVVGDRPDGGVALLARRGIAKGKDKGFDPVFSARRRIFLTYERKTDGDLVFLRTTVL
jgi:hypothetical protein